MPKRNLCPLIKLQRIINFGSRMRKQKIFFSGEGGTICLQRIQEPVTPEVTAAALLSLLFHILRGDGIPVGCFHTLNISQHKYLTALAYEINSSTSVLSHTSLARHQVSKLKPLHSHTAPYTKFNSTPDAQAQQCLRCFPLHSEHNRVHTHPSLLKGLERHLATGVLMGKTSKLLDRYSEASIFTDNLFFINYTLNTKHFPTLPSRRNSQNRE